MRSSKLAKVIARPNDIPTALLRRLAPRSRRFGYDWLFTPHGGVTFRERGFVDAPSPSMLLARHNFETATIRRLMAGHHFDKSLEIGCGYGRLSPVFAENSSHHMAVDINDDALRMARETYDGISFREASVVALPFQDDIYNLVSTWTVLQHVPPSYLKAACAEIARTMAPDGLLLICEETRDPEGTSSHTWHHSVSTYQELFQPLRLTWHSTINEIDRLPGTQSPGTVMLFR